MNETDHEVIKTANKALNNIKEDLNNIKEALCIAGKTGLELFAAVCKFLEQHKCNGHVDLMYKCSNCNYWECPMLTEKDRTTCYHYEEAKAGMI